jgi:hypothetical protein
MYPVANDDDDDDDDKLSLSLLSCGLLYFCRCLPQFREILHQEIKSYFSANLYCPRSTGVLQIGLAVLSAQTGCAGTTYALASQIATHHVTRHNTPIHNILSTAPELSISQKALGTLPEDGNIMPKYVGATIHN